MGIIIYIDYNLSRVYWISQSNNKKKVILLFNPIKHAKGLVT